MRCTDFLSQTGPIAKSLPSYETRPQQVAMAEAVAKAFHAGEHLIVEAGTGVGKSFAYLVPAIELALAGGKRVVVSTHTIALQEQLIQKDIPFLQSIYPKAFTAVLVKGRSNYLGLRRLERSSARQKHLFETNSELAELHMVEDWAYKTEDGSLADLPRQPSPSIWDRVKSDADDCFGRRCPHFQKCFYQRARRRASNAHLLIVNHALLFSDLALRASGGGFLPPYQYLILDEAHTVERVAGDHLGFGVTSSQVRYLLNMLYNERTDKGLLARGPGKGAVHAVREAHADVAAYFDELAAWSAGRVGWNGRLTEPPPVENRVSSRLVFVRDELRGIRERIDKPDDRLELESMMQRCAEMARVVGGWHEVQADDWVYWLEVGRGRQLRVSLNARPVDVGPVLKETLFDRMKSVVLTSATLTTQSESPFGYFRSGIGLSAGRELALGSPFDYRRQLTVYIEDGLPDPKDTASFAPAVCRAIQKYVRLTDGQAFVLFTSYALLQRCAEMLAAEFAAAGMNLLVQGTGMNRSQMLEQFRTTPRAVLFGADTFWAGVDVPGAALSNVIIVKLPFAVPNHPAVEARIDLIRGQGGNPFMDYQLPEAVLKFKQGVGRLIRARSDTGIVVILDPRVRTKPYGRRFVDALPEGATVVLADSTGPVRAPEVS